MKNEYALPEVLSIGSSLPLKKLEKILIHNLLLLAINYNMVYTCLVSIHTKSA